MSPDKSNLGPVPLPPPRGARASAPEVRREGAGDSRTVSRMKRCGFLVALGVAVAAPSPSEAQAPTPPAIAVVEIAPEETSPGGTLDCVVEWAPGERWTLSLSRVSFRSDDFRVLIARGHEMTTSAESFPVLCWRGSVVEHPEYRVRATLRDGRMSALIYGDRSVWGIEPVLGGSGAPRELWHLLYRSDSLPDVGGPVPECGGALQRGVRFGSMPLGIYAEGTRICELAVDADYEYYDENGASVADTLAAIEEILNGIYPIYEAEGIGLAYELTTVVIRTTSSDGYAATGAADLLGEMASLWSEEPEASIPRDIAHLFTGRDLDYGVVGIADLGAVCSGENHYSLSQPGFSTFLAPQVALAAHEIGHNWNATHCDQASDCQIMCSVITGCSGIYDAFGATESGEIADFAETLACLTEHEPPLDPPFVDEFEDGSLSASRWLFAHGASVTESAEKEPSGVASLCLNGEDDGAYSDDEVRSNHILLGTAASASLELHVEPIGVEAGEALVVEFQSSVLAWEELARIESDGSDASAFTLHCWLLPESALHDQFRLRLRVEVDEPDDHWHVDDVRVEVNLLPPAVLGVEPSLGSVLGGNRVTILGAEFLADAVVTIGGTVVADLDFVSSGELAGTVPAGASAGPADVSVGQGSGEGTLHDGYTYVDNLLAAPAVELPAGESLWVAVTASHSLALEGFSVTVDFDSALVQVEEIAIEGTAAEAADVFAAAHDNESESGGGWWSAGVTMNSASPFDDAIPAATDTTLLRILYRVPESATAGARADLVFSDEVLAASGNTFQQNGRSVAPELAGGSITVLEARARFVRGDADGGGALGLADAIQCLELLYADRELPCWDACDFDDNGYLDLADPLGLLAHMLLDGEAPPAPYPDAGVDPTEDDLPCK